MSRQADWFAERIKRGPKKLYDFIWMKYGNVLQCEEHSHLNNTGMAYVNLDSHYAYGYRKSIIEFIACRLKMWVVNMPGSPWMIQNGLLFKGMPIGQEQWIVQGYHVIPFADTHAIEIISGYESLKPTSYFAFLLIFDKFIWLNLFIMLAISVITFTGLSGGHLKMSKAIKNLTSMLVCQATDDQFANLKLNFKFKTSLSKSVFVLLLVIWCQSASILTKAFTGVLLNMYFNVRSGPIVDTMEDIVRKPEMELISDFRRVWLARAQLDLPVEKTQLIYSRSIAFNRSRGYYDRVTFMEPNKVLSGVIEGKSVLLANTEHRIQFSDKWPEFEHKIHISDNKYGPDFLAFILNKFHPIGNISKPWLKGVFESGLDIHYKYLDKIWQAPPKSNFTFPTWYYDIRSQSDPLQLEELFRNSLSVLVLGIILGSFAFATELFSNDKGQKFSKCRRIYH